jgi:hypothetical protein
LARLAKTLARLDDIATLVFHQCIARARAQVSKVQEEK